MIPLTKAVFLTVLWTVSLQFATATAEDNLPPRLSGPGAGALDPDEVAFAMAWCAQQHAGAFVNWAAVQQWQQWNFDIRRPENQCFTRCFLAAVGLYAADVNQFKTSAVEVQYQKYSDVLSSVVNTGKMSKLRKALKELDSGDGSCQAVHSSFKKIWKRNELRTSLSNLYHGNEDILRNLYRKDESIKIVDESAFDFCARTIKPPKQSSCKIRNTLLVLTGIEGKTLEFIDCIFQQFRYMDKNYNIVVDEILSDFKMIGSRHITDAKAILERCRNPAEAGVGLRCYNALLNDPKTKYGFKLALVARRAISSDYFYFVKNNLADLKLIHSRITASKCIN
ncbi:uncharacterized protein LOC128742826 [Sabethes cyaneus]|uniref:uncharacterized protein LOC128742826 n=1 Tax=Sabethes cyaneus TaxID=53552 RepID=UPI00237D63D5|nr:uncharacterized protein LOC128742826 [Sabethes cyaneus]